MTHLKLQKLQKGDYPPVRRLNVNVLLSNITFFVIFAVLDEQLAYEGLQSSHSQYIITKSNQVYVEYQNLVVVSVELHVEEESFYVMCLQISIHYLTIHCT